MSAFVTEPHIVVVLVPIIRTTAFACRYKNKLCVIDLRMNHRHFRSRRVRLGVELFFCGPSRKGTSQKDGDPALQGHPPAPSLGLRQKSAFAQPINYSGRRAAIPEECEIPQKSQVAPLQITLHPRTRFWSLQQFRPPATKSLAQRLSPKLLTNKYYVAYLTVCQKVASIARLAAGAFGFLTFIQIFEGPERFGAFSFFETIPSSPSLQAAGALIGLPRELRHNVRPIYRQ